MHSQSPRPAPSVASFPRTVARWAQQGLLPCQRILGGHRHSPAATNHQPVTSPAQEVRA
jgi:hypothetical protein